MKPTLKASAVRSITLLSLLIFSGLLMAGPAAQAAIFTVNSPEDVGSDNVCDQTECTLREAINNANALGGSNTIEFDLGRIGNLILLKTAELVINSDMTISGPGAGDLEVRRDVPDDGSFSNTPPFRIFRVSSGRIVTISGLTISRGLVGSSGAGGGIYNDHSILTVNDCVIRENYAYNGAGIYSDGSGAGRSATLKVLGSTIGGNRSPAGQGTGIFNNGNDGGTATAGIEDSTVTGDGTPSNARASYGGGIVNSGYSGTAVLEIINSTLSRNFANDYGGAIYNDATYGSATVTITGTTLISNQAYEGGGIYNLTYVDDDAVAAGASINVSGSIFESNKATRDGGGIYNYGYYGSAAVTIANTRFISNTATDNGGGIFNLADSLAPGTGATGAVVRISESSTFTLNTALEAGGGIYNESDEGPATVSFSNSFLSLNTAGDGGGGIYNEADNQGSAVVDIVDSEITGNKATTSVSDGGAIFNTVDEAGTNGTIRITGSLLNGNAAPDRGGAVYSYVFAGTATLSITATELSNNGAQAATDTTPATTTNDGGAIYNHVRTGVANLTFTDSLLSANSAFDGGAIQNEIESVGSVAGVSGTGTLTITRTTLNANSAGRGGAISNYVEVDDSGPTSANLSTTIDRSAIIGNQASGSAGAIRTDANNRGVSTLKIQNTTLSGNSAVESGGAIWNDGSEGSSTVSIDNSTLADNTVPPESEYGGSSIYNTGGGGGTSAVSLANSILRSGSRDRNIINFNNAGTITSRGYNLSAENDGAFLTGPGDLVNTDPKLAALANYGGPTLTMALQPGSPAYNAGDPNFDPNAFSPAMTTDQRGRPRVRGGRLDIGAYEAPPPPVLTAPANNARTGATPELSATTEPFNTVIFTITGGSSPVQVVRIADQNGNVTANSPALPEGTYSISAVAAFGSELASSPSATHTFVIDATPPVISGVPADIAVEATGPNGATVTYTQPTANDNVDGTVPVSCSPPSGSTFALGTTLVSCSATDQSGNTSRASFNVTVRDTTAPVISNVPANITTTATESDGAVVTYDSPTASDAVSGNVAVSCSPASGSKFPIGTTTVTCSASDAAGNTASVSFTVTVEEATPTPSPSPSPSATPTAMPAQPVNISTRVNVGTGSNVMIGGFIITGDAAKKVILRGIGPSTGIDGALADPVLELNGPDGFATITNDNWEDSQKDEIERTGIAPKDPREAAIVVTLQPGAYTGIVRGRDNTTGIAVVEVYDLSLDAPSQLANISTRGFVQTVANVIIGGFILGGNAGDELNIIVRAIGPSLADAGVTNALPNPALDIRDKDGNRVASNDDWQDDANAAKVAQNEVAPKNEREAALYLTLPPGQYTAIVAGEGQSTGVGLVEIYHVE